MGKINPHVLCDWGVMTGRLGLDARPAFLAAFMADPLTATGELLLAEPTRDAGRPCPLLGPVSADRRQAAIEGHATRQRRSQAFQAVALEAARAAVRSTGEDPDVPRVRQAVGEALRDLADGHRAADRRQSRSDYERKRRAAKREGRANDAAVPRPVRRLNGVAMSESAHPSAELVSEAYRDVRAAAAAVMTDAASSW